MVKRNFKKDNLFIVFAFVFSIFLVGLIIAVPPSFTVTRTNSTFEEGRFPVFSYNFTANVTDTEGDILTFSINQINSTLYFAEEESFYTWIDLNSTSGILIFNSTRDNETGKFNISINVYEYTPDPAGSTDVFYFIVNATNDAPEFTNIDVEYNLTYNLTSTEIFLEFLNASDEEEHYPLLFNVTFLDNCVLAEWSSRANCSLLNSTFYSNNSAMMNYTPILNDVGVYYANISIMDAGQDYNCSSGYCAANYSNNRTTYYSGTIVFNVFTDLQINISDCNNSVFQENSSNICHINVTSRGITDSINSSSIAFLRNYDGSISNSSWFYSLNETATNNYTQTLYINVTPEKTEIGNWTINFTVFDLTHNTGKTKKIYIYVNRTYNDVPELATISNYNTSISKVSRINLTSYDDDLLIPDKNVEGGGYNESINFSISIFNQSDLTQELSLTGFEVEVLTTTLNRTDAKIEFTPNSSEFGNYTINITINDVQNAFDNQLFNLTIISNNAPQWNETLQTVYVIYEDNNTYLNLSQNISDSDGDTLLFSYVNDTAFSSFSLNLTTGEINFTPIDADVGQHIVDITISDGYLTDVASFNFTIYNINDTPVLETPILSSDGINISVDANSNINCTEDNYTMITLWIQDEDFKIPLNQKSFYNENLTINLTIEGANTDLFLFTKNIAFPIAGSNRSKYEAIFTPEKSDVGDYNITINISDVNQKTVSIEFNLTIKGIQHNPVLIDLINQSSAENRSFSYLINVSDDEDGFSNSSGNANFTFGYNFLSGNDFINSNESIFNTTTGLLDITFNSSHGGTYHINISVNDSVNSFDYDDFRVFVYDIPTANYPSSTYKFSLAENMTTNLTFTVNNSVGKNLTYHIYLEDGNITTTLYNSSFYGNNSNLSFQYTPNFTQEASLINITLITYPLESSLLNRIEVNLTQRWNITINHTNYPISILGAIGGADNKISGGSPQSVILSDHFRDYDASDSSYNQTIGFRYNLLSSSGGVIAVNIVNWTNASNPNVSFSATSNSNGNFTITAYEYNSSNSLQLLRNITSENFTIELTVETVSVPVPVPSSGGGGGGSGSKPVAFKIIAPGQISAFANQRIIVPISLVNTGLRSFGRISLISVAFKDGDVTNKVRTSWDNDFIKLLGSGDRENLILTVFLDTNETGDYEILLNATSESPRYTDWTKIYINLQKTNQTEIEKFLLFTEEMIVQNPECLELRELVDEAKNLFNQGDYSGARVKAEQAVNACREFVSQVSLPSLRPPWEYGINEYLVLVTLLSFMMGVSYYFVKRRRFKKAIRLGA